MPKKKEKNEKEKTRRKDKSKAKSAPKNRTAEATTNYGITEQQLETLREAYNANLIGKGAIGAFSRTFAPAGDLARVIVDRFYSGDDYPDRLSARDRELVLLGFFVAEPGVNFATHVYLALMEGVSPGEIYDTAYLMALYRGADLWTGAELAITKTLALLAVSADGGNKTASTPAVLTALRQPKT